MRDFNLIIRYIGLLVCVFILAFNIGNNRTEIANLQQQVKQLQGVINADGN